MSSGMSGAKTRGVFGSIAELQASNIETNTTVWIHNGAAYDLKDDQSGADFTLLNGRGAFLRVGNSTNWGGIGGLISDQSDLQTELDNKVDKISGKGLSENDYDNAAASEVAKVADKVDKVAGKELSDNNYDDDAVAKVAKIDSKKDKTTKTTASTGDLPAWASWIADSSGGALSRPMNPAPIDGEESECIDATNSAATNNITHTVVAPTTITNPTLDTNGQSKKWRYDATGDVWDLVFSQAPASGGGGASIKEITHFRLDYPAGTSNVYLNFPTGSDQSKTYPVFHDRQAKKVNDSTSDQLIGLFAGMDSLQLQNNRFRMSTFQSTEAGAISGYWIEFEGGVNVQYGLTAVNTSSADVTVPISTISDPSRAFIIDLSTNTNALRFRNYTLENLTATDFTVSREASGGGSFNLGWCVVEFL